MRSVNGIIIIILLSLKSEKWRADQSACAWSESGLNAGGDSDEYSDLPYSLYLLHRYSIRDSSHIWSPILPTLDRPSRVRHLFNYAK